MTEGTFTRYDLSGRFLQIVCARSLTCRDLNVELKPSAFSSVYIIVFCVKKVFKNFTTEKKSLNREKSLWFVTDFSPNFSNRERLMRVLT